jgi:hypothetical protein
VKVTGKDSYLSDENTAYLIDYRVNSPKIPGAKSSGSVYIRGIKGQEGWDSFKFVLEKANDFSDFDAELVVKMYEKALSNLGGDVAPEVDTTGMTPAQAKFAKRMAAKNGNNSQPIKGFPGLTP